MKITTQQWGVVRGVVSAAAVLAAVSAFCIMQQPFPAPEDRLSLWLKWNIPKAACLWASIWRIGNFRFSSPADIDGAGLSTTPTAQIKLMQAILQNTLEQVVLATLVHGAFAVLAPDTWLILIPAYSILFVVGRILFAVGYGAGAGARAPGFALTMLPTSVMMLASTWLLLFNPW